MTEWVKFSLSSQQVKAFKECVTCNAPYASRISLGFAYDLASLNKLFRETPDILRELDSLEGITPNISTKPAAQFEHPPLHPFWHKHFYSSRHQIRNGWERWGLGKGGNGDFKKMIEQAFVTYGDQPNLCIKRMSYDFVMGGLEDRSAAWKITGDWIIFAKHGGQNYYLGLVPHPEIGQNVDQQIYDKLRQGSAWEFPFLFK